MPPPAASSENVWKEGGVGVSETYRGLRERCTASKSSGVTTKYWSLLGGVGGHAGGLPFVFGALTSELLLLTRSFLFDMTL
jgi:hypothetical protein